MTLSSFVEDNEEFHILLSYEMNRNSADKIKTVLTSCNDKRIKNEFMQRLISLILDLMCGVGETEVPRSGAMSANAEMILAKSSIYIGILRFHLMLPKSPLDPSEEVLHQIDAYNDRLK